MREGGKAIVGGLLPYLPAWHQPVSLFAQDRNQQFKIKLYFKMVSKDYFDLPQSVS